MNSIEFAKYAELILAVLAAVALLGALLQGISWAWYGTSVAVPFAWAYWSHGPQDYLYAWAFFLGMITAFAEIIGKFRDEPLKALITREAFVYHVVNGLIAAFSLRLLILLKVPTGTELDEIKAVASAGLGSMLLMRSKLFDIKIPDTDKNFSFGPDQILKVYFGFMEQAIGRVRAQSRLDFVVQKMSIADSINFNEIVDYTGTMLDALQTLDDSEKRRLMEKIKRTDSQQCAP